MYIPVPNIIHPDEAIRIAKHTFSHNLRKYITIQKTTDEWMINRFSCDHHIDIDITSISETHRVDMTYWTDDRIRNLITNALLEYTKMYFYVAVLPDGIVSGPWECENEKQYLLMTALDGLVYPDVIITVIESNWADPEGRSYYQDCWNEVANLTK